MSSPFIRTGQRQSALIGSFEMWTGRCQMKAYGLHKRDPHGTASMPTSASSPGSPFRSRTRLKLAPAGRWQLDVDAEQFRPSASEMGESPISIALWQRLETRQGTASGHHVQGQGKVSLAPRRRSGVLIQPILPIGFRVSGLFAPKPECPLTACRCPSRNLPTAPRRGLPRGPR